MSSRASRVSNSTTTEHKQSRTHFVGPYQHSSHYFVTHTLFQTSPATETLRADETTRILSKLSEKPSGVHNYPRFSMQRRLPPVPQAEGHQRHPSTDLNHFSTPSFATPQLPSPAQIPQSPVGGSNNVSNSDTSPAQEGASEPDQPRAKRTKKQFPGRNLPKTSCLRCKSKKMRCESSEQTSGICKRCEKGRFVCEYQVPDGKPKNGRCELLLSFTQCV